ncbi:complement C1q subcomponent subunit C-like isoform X1 [Acanthopagrus latus]|uniref:complement C1q subcomponent subunit C-like isoform X1 n=1 Tax=Acanthopagrus latus TaxID=8177 RepID=UPI00187C5925|nr:complement C1q subcomponent subunit C-like isoform X1 [Acanthopagrus latus]
MMRRATVVLALLLCLQWTWAQTDRENKNSEVQFESRGAKAAPDQSRTNVTPDIWAELKELRHKIEKLEQENAALEAKMSSSVNDVEEMKRVTADPTKVAFTASLAVDVGPGTDATLRFLRVLTNIGQAYNPDTGIFTAPVTGAYYFRFTLWNRRTNTEVGASLHHNYKRMMNNSDYNDHIAYVSLSNGIVLHLEQGDEVFMTIDSYYSISDTGDNRTTFSGFLLFPL